MLHRNIKGLNLLLDNNGVLEISDFSLASFFISVVVYDNNLE
jgi:serine/threonine protein kinase